MRDRAVLVETMILVDYLPGLVSVPIVMQSMN